MESEIAYISLNAGFQFPDEAGLRRWQEDAFKGSIRKAVLICQSITGLAFPIENYVPDLSLPAAKKLLESITKAK